MDFWYDNSAANPLNPYSPPQTVSWGDFSTDEMGICYFQVTTDKWDDFVALSKHNGKYFQRLWQRYQHRKQAQKSVESRLDGNR